MVRNKSEKYVVRSIRIPDKIWNLLKRISSSGYRPVNSQLIKVLEDWLIDHGYMKHEERSKFEE